MQGSRARSASRTSGTAKLSYTGEYVEIVAHRRLAFILLMEDHWYVTTRVMVEITALKTGCELTLVHEDVPSHYAGYTEARWSGILYGLGVTLAAWSTRGLELMAHVWVHCRFPDPAID